MIKHNTKLIFLCRAFKKAAPLQYTCVLNYFIMSRFLSFDIWKLISMLLRISFVYHFVCKIMISAIKTKKNYANHCYSQVICIKQVSEPFKENNIFRSFYIKSQITHIIHCQRRQDVERNRSVIFHFNVCVNTISWYLFY